MKKYLFILLPLIFVSCSNLLTENKTAEVKFTLPANGLSGIRSADPDNGDSDDKLDIELVLEGDAKQVIKDKISFRELVVNEDSDNSDESQKYEEKTFSFSNVTVGANVTVSCTIKLDEEPFYFGKSEIFKVQQGVNSISLKIG